jgi:hypothetical protein
MTMVIRPTSSVLSRRDRWDHVLARWGVRRSEHRIEPGLYAVGDPGPNAPVFVTANYTLSFDALRVALQGKDGYILVLDTKGINVWCAAGKGAFGTDELVHRIEVAGLANIVEHRKLILPQLGAPGVSAHQVKARSGFHVEYGPVRAADLPQYLALGKATPEMRRVRFDLWDRLVLIPVELVHVVLPTVVAALVLVLVGGVLPAIAACAAVGAGVVLFPILLPWLPTRAFSSRGFILGGLVALPFAVAAYMGGGALWRRIALTVGYLLAMPPVTAYLALNFTGSTPLTSRTGVRQEIFTYVPVMAWTFGIGLLALMVFSLIRS